MKGIINSASTLAKQTRLPEGKTIPLAAAPAAVGVAAPVRRGCVWIKGLGCLLLGNLPPDIQSVSGGAALLSRSISSSDAAAQPPASPAPHLRSLRLCRHKPCRSTEETDGQGRSAVSYCFYCFYQWWEVLHSREKALLIIIFHVYIANCCQV